MNVNSWKQVIAAFTSAFIFGLGLGVSGMTLPAKVIGFLDVTGHWDYSLAFVMMGAIIVHGTAYRMITRRRTPVLASSFQISNARHIDFRLIIGAILFGVGWGLGGFCPGPAIVAVVSGHASVLWFVFSMIAGVYLHRAFTLTLFSPGRRG